ncbi:DUF2628 domain-containing protein [Stappia sp. ES.058]|uniref:DUF2628 domain-containing protein n=1 Tax=Stappia sp. ES.058 TaxID=1881061 RepID=UPI00087999B5|nr:DUF2628 domain-containing protein [Stappia sp. ES.058]SDU43917.1 Protein of unknown function [Stappia sp. ES.058]
MTMYTVLIPPDTYPDSLSDTDLDRVTFIKEGFCWPALYIAVIWMLFRRLWLVVIVYLVLALLLEFVTRQIGGVAPLLGGLLFAVLVALEANGLRRWTMERRGWQFVATVEGSTLADAEQRFFSALAARQTTPAPATPAPAPRMAPANAPRFASAHVVGLTPGPRHS